MPLNRHVGYLSSGFEYFLNGFAHTLDQVRPTLDQDTTRRALSNALLFFLETPCHPEEKPKILQKMAQKTLKIITNLEGFAHRLDQVRSIMDLDRTR